MAHTVQILSGPYAHALLLFRHYDARRWLMSSLVIHGSDFRYECSL